MSPMNVLSQDLQFRLFTHKISSYTKSWTQIPFLKSLENGDLDEFWYQVDEFMVLVQEEVHLKSAAELAAVLKEALLELIRLGDFTRVEFLIHLLRQKAEQENDRETWIWCSFLLGSTAVSLREFDNAEQFFIDALNHLTDSLEDQIWRVKLFGNLSLVKAYQNIFDLAEYYSHRALRTLARLSPLEYNRIAHQRGAPSYEEQRSSILENIVAICFESAKQQERTNRRSQLIQKAIRYHMRATRGGISTYHQLRAQANISHGYIVQGEFAKAEYLLQDLLDKCEPHPAYRRLVSYVYGFRAESAILQGRLHEAISLSHKALQLAIQASDPILMDQSILYATEPLRELSREILARDLGSRHIIDVGLPVFEALLEFLEDKDWYTARDHSMGVCRTSVHVYDVLSKMIGTEAIGQDRETIEVAGLLHDIGKLWTPWTILNRTTPLLDRELQIIHVHPRKGQECLEDLGFSTIADIISLHHERPDGKGYPSGCMDGRYAGQILAVADCFEAMTTSNRRYRNPKSLESAVYEIRRNAGSQFNEQVADALRVAVLG